MAHQAVAAPYSPAEMAIVRRVAQVQPTPLLTRQVCLLVGLGAGAGIDSTDLKRLQAMELTAASTDIVDASLRLIDQIRERAPFERIIGDRPYGYKKLERWAMELWRRRIPQVLDLRADKPGAVDQYVAKIIDGRPHCPGMATHLEVLSPSEDRAEQATFRQQIQSPREVRAPHGQGPACLPNQCAQG